MPSAARSLRPVDSLVRAAPAAAGQTPPLLPVVGAGLPVPRVLGEPVPYANLDVAASAPCLAPVHEAVSRALPWYGSVHRGAGFLSTVSTSLLAAARDEVGRFCGARPDDAVVFTRHTTDALNLLAAALPEDTGVVAFASEHHANLLPWRARGLVQLPPPRSHAQALAEAGEALAGLPTSRRLLAVTGASNVTGELFPIARLCEVARRHRARIVIDAAQLAPHRAIDLAALGADWVAFSGHKLYAPFGCGALVGRSDWLDGAEPWLRGGGAVQKVTLSGADWASGPARHEAGTPNLPGAIALAAACRALRSAGFARLEVHEAALSRRLLDGLRALPGVEVLSLFGPQAPRIGVAAFTARGWKPGLLAAALSAEHGIGVRDGAFCAHPLLAELVGGEQPAAVRASLGACTGSGDVDRLLAALEELLRSGPRWSYRQDRGRWVPDPDPRPLPDLDLGFAEPAPSPCAAVS